MASEAVDSENQMAEAETPVAVPDNVVVPLSIEEIKVCNVREMAKDKFKSRQLQRTLSRGGHEHTQLIFEKTQPHIAELVCDQHGNYLIQKLMEVISDDQFTAVFECLKETGLISMAQDSHGTRAVQKIVEQCISRKRVEYLIQALPPQTAEELARHITGFHVIVKMLESLPAENATELLERICGEPDKVLELGKDQWGCCVLKKCVDRAEGPLKEKIIDSIAQHSLDLVQDAFGNYVVQHLVINRPPGQITNTYVSRIIDAFKGHVYKLSLQKYSSNVLEKCLGNSGDKDRNKIINEILNPPGIQPSEAVRKLLFHQFGNYVIQQALEVAKDPQYSLLIEHCKQHVQEFYIEATKNTGQGDRQADAAPTQGAGGSLPSQHAQRIAVKLVKKYPGMTEGMDMGSVMAGMDAAWMFDYDPMGYGMGYFDVDAYGYPMPTFDAFYGAPYGPGNITGYPASQKAPRGGRGGGRGQKSKAGGKKGGGKGGGGKGSDVADGGETVKVGRIVGFWPNYTYVEDEVPTASPSRPQRQKKANAKGKAAPKAKSAASA